MIKGSQNGRRFILINILDWLWKVNGSCGDRAGEARWRSGPAWDTVPAVTELLEGRDGTSVGQDSQERLSSVP